MPSETASERLNEIAEAAIGLFGERGYRRTQVADVARALSVSPGLLYRYVEGKEALFHCALERALAPDRALAPAVLPVPNPEPGATLALVRTHLETWAAAPELDAALAREATGDARAELEAVVGAFYDGASQRRRAADLVERSALDLPELAALWFGEIRHEHFARLTRYLERRMRAGQLRALPDPGVAARIVVETVVFFARHRHRDSWEKLDEDAVRRTVVEFVLAALVP